MQLRSRKSFASSPLRLFASFVMTSMVFTFTACKDVVNLTVTTSAGKYVTGSTTPQLAPLQQQTVTGVFQFYTSSENRHGSVTSFYHATDSTGSFTIDNLEMPSQWNLTWINNPPFCVDQDDITQHLTVPWVTTWNFQPFYSSNNSAPLTCYINDPSHPNFTYTNVSPQFSLDNVRPSSLWVASLDQIPSGGTTSLNVYDMSLNNVATLTATAISPNGVGATFPYPTAGNLSLPAGAYITTITNQDGSDPLTTHGMEPFYIGHNDESFTGAYGVAVASPQEITTVLDWKREVNNCNLLSSTTTTQGGTPLPLVTLISQGKLAVGSMSNLLTVGTNPTVVLPFNDQPQVTNTTVGGNCPVMATTRSYSGAQSAFVVNTGSNNVSIVEIGELAYPQGTVTVGNQPVAAAINPAETFAYVANYLDGTISEVDLHNLVQTRVLTVMANPTSVAFDNSGNLWVGGQGSVSEISLASWSVGTTYPVDGTVNGMSYDVAGGVMIQALLQNGSSSNLSNGATAQSRIAFSMAPQSSYSTQNALNTSTGASTVSTQFIGDNAAYSQSLIAPLLAFPAQTAINPPIYSSTNGDMTATITGTTFNVSVVGTGQILIQGTLPYPARGVALTNNMLYVTMPDSNSLVSLPIPIP